MAARMREDLQRETEQLTRSWMRHDQAALRDYLVAGVEDPRVNVQSLITRHFFISALCGGRFQELMDQELRFAVAMNWLLDLLTRALGVEDLHAVLHGLRRGADDAEGIEIPSHVARLFAALPATADGMSVPNYLESFLTGARVEEGKLRPGAAVFDVFVALWNQALAAVPRSSPAPSVLEAASGSANDYRILHACGLARVLDYSGFDLCEKNVLNARSMFPGARFAVGNVFDIAAPDQAFDYLFAHDLFEHLSPDGLEAAVKEVCRVTRRGLCLGFFNMDEIPEHIVRPVEDYHWNTLSVDRVRELFAGHGFGAQVVHIGSFLRWAAGCPQTHNRNAYTVMLRR